MIAVAIAVYQLAFFAAVDRTGVAVGTVVALGSAPAIAGVAGRLIDGEPLTGRWAAATALACAGVLLLVLGGGGASVDPLGIMLAMASGTGYATYTVLAKRLLRRGHAPERVMAASLLARRRCCSRRCSLLGDVSWLATGDGLAMALFLGAIPTALAYVLFARGLRHLTPGETATLTLAEPLTATGLGVVALGERPGAVAAIGAGLVLAGLLALGAARAARGRRGSRGRPHERAARPRARLDRRRDRGRAADADPRRRAARGRAAARARARRGVRRRAPLAPRRAARARRRGARHDRAQPRRAASPRLTPADVAALFELRTALELEAARLALERHDGALPKPVHDAVRLMAAVCAQPEPPWSAVVDAHDRVHGRARRRRRAARASSAPTRRSPASCACS